MPAWIERLRVRKRKRELQKNSDNLYHFLELDLVKADTLQKRRDIESLRQFLCAQFDEEIQAIDSSDLVERAKRCHIEVSDLGLRPEHEDHWIHGVHGSWFLHPKSFRALEKNVEESERERIQQKAGDKDFWWKFVIATAAIIAALASILNLVRHR